MRARLDRSELSGALGDLGTFLPLLVAMSVENGLDFAAALFFAGLFNVVTGVTFGIPMAVQPMKAIAAVALAQGLPALQVVAAGASVSAIVLLAGVTGFVETLSRIVPKPVVRGVQLALALTLVTKGLGMVSATGAWLSLDGFATALAAAALVVGAGASSRVPVGLVLFVVGLAIAAIVRPEGVQALAFGLWTPSWTPPAWNDFVTAFPVATVPQVPLTLVNSVVAVCALSSDLFPDRPAAPRKVAISVGLMNLTTCWFGAMPMCHGAGGLAGQYRFGARTAGSILFLGAAKTLLAVLFGASLVTLVAAFPASILGVMVVASGLELGVAARDQTERDDAYAMLVTAGVALGTGNIALGLAAGWLVALRQGSWTGFAG
ncbi:MAG: putative sulfate/molybdate transporter [Lacipirellulaceae bacterium]